MFATAAASGAASAVPTANSPPVRQSRARSPGKLCLNCVMRVSPHALRSCELFIASAKSTRGKMRHAENFSPHRRAEVEIQRNIFARISQVCGMIFLFFEQIRNTKTRDYRVYRFLRCDR